jgi:transposase, IS5 family
LAQTDQRLAGNRMVPDRLLSLSGPDTHPIGQRKPPFPDRVGHKLLLAEDQRGFVADTQPAQQREPV